MSRNSNDLFRFDDFEMQPSRRLLLRAGSKVAVAPKSFEVLLCLVQNAGRVVLKDEIFSTVWPGSFVEESNLSQHVFWLRKALGEKSGYIVTYPGRGYEFTGPVVAVTEAAQAITEAPLAQPPQAIAQPLPPADLEPVVPAPKPAIDSPVRAVPDRRRRLWPQIVGAVVVLAVAVPLGYSRWRVRTIPGDHHEIVLADFQNSTGDPNLDKPLKTLLAVDLNESPLLAVATDADIRKILRLMNRPADSEITPAAARDICERLNDQAVLAGAIARIGQKYLITLTATDCSTGRNLAQTKAEVDSREGIIQGVDSVAAQMRKRLGEPLRARSGTGPQLLPAHTFSLEGLEAYSQARLLHQRLKFTAAVPLYQKAIALDPNFADAYAQLGNCYNNLGEAMEGRKAMARAYELRDQADEPDRLRITAMYEYWKTGDRHAAIRNYQTWTQIYPLSTNAWVLLGEFQASVGRMDLAVAAAKRAVANNPSSTSATQDLAQWLRSDGLLDEARATCLGALRRGLDSVTLHRTLLEVAFLQHDPAAFDEQMIWYRDKAEDDDREGMQADYDASQGRMRSAVAHWQHLADAEAKGGMHEAALELFAAVPQMEADLGLLPQARAHLKRFQADSPLTEPSTTAIIIAAAEAGDRQLAEKKLQVMLDNGKEDSDVREIFGPESRAALALAASKPAEAIAAMQPAAPFELTDPSVPALSGQAHLAARQSAEAQREFRVVTDRPFTSAISSNVPLAHLGLARALVLDENPDAARQEYQTFFTLWKNADADLPILIKAHAEYAHLH